MKQTRKALLIILTLLLVLATFAGCNPIPEEYTDGVRLERDYPEDDMPIFDDAVIYYCEDDDNAITIRFGTQEDLDDVADFYKDFFEDNEIVLDDETDRSTKYKAEGYYKDFYFELKASDPSGEYEEKLFVTTVKIEIEFGEAPVPDEPPLQDRLVGFWRQESFDQGLAMLNILDEGKASDILADGTIIAYDDFKWLGTATWEVIDENTFQINSSQGDTYVVTVAFEIRDGVEYLIWEDTTGVFELFRGSSQDFSTSEMTDTVSDEKLTEDIADITWYYVHYSDPDGSTGRGSVGSVIYYSDGTFQDTTNNSALYGDWYISNGLIYCEYIDSELSDSSWPVEIKTEDDTDYLYYYGTDEPEYWLYCKKTPSDIPPPPAIEISETYTSDDDLLELIVNVQWHKLYYLNSDGSAKNIKSHLLIFSQNGLMEDTWGPDYRLADWEIQDGILAYTYRNGETVYSYPIYIELGADGENLYLYIGDLIDEQIIGNWVFTAYKP